MIISGGMAKTSKTMKEIAAELGVSRTTVSLVLQGRGDEYRISRETQRTILSYVEQAEYRPNYFAKALNRGRSDIIGAVFPDVFESFMGNIIRGIESVLYPEGYSLMISTSSFDNRREKRIVEKMVWQGVDGIILVPTMPFRKEGRYEGSHIAPLAERGYPLVAVDRTVPGIETSTVLQNDREAAFSAVTELLRGGIRSLFCLSFDLEASSIGERLEGYRRAVGEAGLAERMFTLQALDPESGDLERLIDALHADGSRPEGWFVTTSGLSEKLAWLLKQKNDDARIARFGEAPPWADSRMRDIPHPHREMGRAAAELILELIDAPGTPPRSVICPSGG